jgi:transcriptional regulator with XRE-family HTH domain
VKLRTQLGIRVRELRLRRGLTQEQLGARAGLSYKFLGEVERGTANPTVKTLGALATGLDTGVADLFGPPARADEPLTTVTDGDLRAIEKAVRNLSVVLDRLKPPRRPRARSRRT